MYVPEKCRLEEHVGGWRYGRRGHGQRGRGQLLAVAAQRGLRAGQGRQRRRRPEVETKLDLVHQLNEAKSVAGKHWLRLLPSVALLRGQVWSTLGIRCQQPQLVD